MLGLENLPIYYELVGLRSLSEHYFRIWYYNQSEQNELLFKTQMESWILKAEKYGEKGEQCRIYLLMARYALVKFNFSELDEYLDKCAKLANVIEVNYYKLYVEKITEELSENRERLENILKSEKLLLPEDKDRIMKKYLERAVLLMKKNKV